METISKYVGTEEEIILGIEEGQSELRAGRGIANDEIARQFKTLISVALKRQSKTSRADGLIGHPRASKDRFHQLEYISIDSPQNVEPVRGRGFVAPNVFG